MPNKRRDHKPEPLELIPTLWSCDQCDALIAIYSIEIHGTPTCPICCEATMNSLGTFETVLGMAAL
jgi:hypothetical protein